MLTVDTDGKGANGAARTVVAGNKRHLVGVLTHGEAGFIAAPRVHLVDQHPGTAAVPFGIGWPYAKRTGGRRDRRQQSFVTMVEGQGGERRVQVVAR